MVDNTRPDVDEARAQVFVTAFNTLPKETRGRVLEILLADEDMRDLLEGALLWEERKNGEFRPFRAYLKERGEAF